MTVLGVTFDLSQVWGGSVKVANKDGRLDRILQISRDLAQTNEPTMHDISVLQGLLNFAGGFVAGRAFKPILHFVQQMVRSKDFSSLKRLQDDMGGHRLVHHGTVPHQMIKAWQATAGEQII